MSGSGPSQAIASSQPRLAFRWFLHQDVLIAAEVEPAEVGVKGTGVVAGVGIGLQPEGGAGWLLARPNRHIRPFELSDSGLQFSRVQKLGRSRRCVVALEHPRCAGLAQAGLQSAQNLFDFTFRDVTGS